MKPTKKKVAAKDLVDKEGNRKVLPIDNVEVEWTEKDKHHEAGTKNMIHREQANKLSEAGKCKIVEGGAEETGKTQDDDGGVTI